MGQKIGHQFIRDFLGGMITEVSDYRMPDNAMRLIQNMDTDIIGSLRVRKGTTVIGNQVQDNKNCLGLYNFRDSGAGTNNRQIACFNNVGDTNSVVYYNLAGVWTAVGGASSFTAGAKFRFVTFTDLVFIVTSAFSTPVTWNGAGASAVANTQVVSAPSGQFINVFKSRVYIASTSAKPDRVFFSSIIDTNGNITWNTTDDYLDVNPSDGQNITGITNNGTLLLIFKDRAMYRWNGSSTDADLIVDVGCSSQESIANRNGQTYFFNPFGVYVTTGGFPQVISKPIQRWIDAISGSYYANVAGVCDDDHYYCSIGDVTVDGESFENVVLVYEISSQNWSVRTYPEQVRLFANYIESNNTANVMIGNDDGDVQRFDYGSTDAGVVIPYKVRTKRVDFTGGSFAFDKMFSEVWIFGSQLVGAFVRVFTDEDTRPRTIMQTLKKWWAYANGLKYQGKWFVFEISGQSRDGQGELFGLEIDSPSLEGKGTNQS
jgi:hypothetical protein